MSEPIGPAVPAPGLPIRTERLLLRRYRPEDVDAVHAYYRLAEVNQYLLTEPFSREFAELVVGQRADQVEPTAPGDGLALLVEHEGAVVGDVVLTLKDLGGVGDRGVEDRGGVAELGWVFAPWAGGRGLATEAVAALADLAFDHVGVHRVVARCDARNTASARLCERLGMVREAHLRQDWWSKGEWTDTLVFALLRTDR